MSRQTSAVVSGEESGVHDEPHVRGRRVTVHTIHARVEERGLRPETVAERLDLSLADVYAALAYYHDNPEAMAAAERRREAAAEVARERSELAPSDT